MGIRAIFVLFMIFALMSAGKVLRESKEAEGVTDFDIYNYTESKLKWNFNYNESIPVSNSTKDLMISRVSNFAYKISDAIGYGVMQFYKFGIEFGYNNPQYDFEYCIKYVMKLVLFFGCIAVIPVVPYLLGTIYLVLVGIVWFVKLFIAKIVEWRVNRE